MTIPLGMPVQFRDGTGDIHAGFVSGIDVNGFAMVTWYVTGTQTWSFGVVATRDDTQTINDSWAPITFNASTVVLSGV